MSKITAIDLGILVEILSSNVNQQQKEEILKEINEALKEEEEAKTSNEDKPPKIPKKTVIVLTSVPEGFDPQKIEDIVGFITEIPEDDQTSHLRTKFHEAKQIYNDSKKAKKNPAESLGELFEFAPLKTFKEAGVLKKPKGPIEFYFQKNRS